MPCSRARRAKRKRRRRSLDACLIRARVSSGCALAIADQQDTEDALIEAVEVPEEVASVSVSLDATVWSAMWRRCGASDRT